jgi:hypothetical protein
MLFSLFLMMKVLSGDVRKCNFVVISSEILQNSKNVNAFIQKGNIYL